MGLGRCLTAGALALAVAGTIAGWGLAHQMSGIRFGGRLPLSRLLNLYVDATQQLFRATQKFLGKNGTKVPYIIGMAGSVAVGKSTTARILQALLARWPNHPKVDLVTTDGFLLPNATLEREGILDRKGFPESYDLPAMLRFLTDIKAGASGRD